MAVSVNANMCVSEKENEKDRQTEREREMCACVYMDVDIYIGCLLKLSKPIFQPKKLAIICHVSLKFPPMSMFVSRQRRNYINLRA